MEKIKGVKCGYRLVEDHRMDVMEDKVKRLMSEGWKPLGGIATTYASEYDEDFFYTQAMIKEDKTP